MKSVIRELEEKLEFPLFVDSRPYHYHFITGSHFWRIRKDAVWIHHEARGKIFMSYWNGMPEDYRPQEDYSCELVREDPRVYKRNRQERKNPLSIKCRF